MLLKRSYLSFLILLLFSVSGNAQKFLSKEWFAEKKVIRARKVEEGRLLLTPLAGPAYSPELKFALAGGVRHPSRPTEMTY